MTNKSPLVSIVVITFNSSAYLIETLNSIRDQTYENIELIISDDFSTDDTIKLSESWKNENKHVKTRIVRTPVNTGIPINCNRGFYSAEGEWIKPIAGDDILVNTCIEDYISYVTNNPEIKAVCSKFQKFNDVFSKDRLYNADYSGYANFYSDNRTVKQQFKILQRRNFLHGPTFFISKSLFIEVGGFDEKYKFEDLPMALKITKAGFKLHFLNKVTVYYRKHASSITAVKNGDKLFSNFYKEKYKFDKDYIFIYANVIIKISLKLEYYRLFYLDKLGFNKNNRISRFVYRLTFMLNPLNPYNLYF